jgi:hypothetical protein
MGQLFLFTPTFDLFHALCQQGTTDDPYVILTEKQDEDDLLSAS